MYTLAKSDAMKQDAKKPCSDHTRSDKHMELLPCTRLRGSADPKP